MRGLNEQHLRNKFFALSLLPLLMTPVAAPAQDTAVGANVTTLVNQPTAAKPWSLPVTLEYASSLHKEDAYEHVAQENLILAPSYKLSEHWSAGLLTSIYKDDSNGEEGGTTAWDNTRFSISRKAVLAQNAVWSQGAGAILATNQSLREQTTFQGGLRLSTGVLWTELFRGSSLQYGLTFTRNFHEYTINADGGLNVRESLANSLDFSLPLSGPLSLETAFMYTAGRTYHDDLKTKFVLAANLVWQANKDLSLAVGTSNEGNALGPNGTDSNIEFFNDNSSLFKLGLTYNL